MKLEINKIYDQDCLEGITYVVATYSAIHDRWYPYSESENIEEAQERLEGLSQRRHGKFAIFERIRSEVITKLN